MKLALVGRPLCGKTTVASLMSGQPYDAAPAFQAGGKPRLVTVKVPDARVEGLSAHFKPKKTTFATIELFDTPSLSQAPEARDANRQILNAVREADGVLAVLGAHARTEPAGSADWIAALKKELDELHTEFLVSDLDSIEKRIERLKVEVARPKPSRDTDKREMEILELFGKALNEGKPISSVSLPHRDDQKIVKGFRFFTEKAVVAVLNVGDGEAAKAADLAKSFGGDAVALSARLELELSQMTAEERAEFMPGYGIAALVAPTLPAVAYRRLGLCSFLTAGEDECRAWTIAIGDDVVTAAGKIHTDLAKGFISAEVVAYDDWKTLGGMKEARAKGRFRVEGRTYIVQDGDIINIRFNV